MSRAEKVDEESDRRRSSRSSSGSSSSRVSVVKPTRSKRNILRRGSASGHKLTAGAGVGQGKEYKRSSFMANSSVKSGANNNKKVEIKNTTAGSKRDPAKEQRSASHKNLTGKGGGSGTSQRRSKSRKMKMVSQEIGYLIRPNCPLKVSK